MADEALCEGVRTLLQAAAGFLPVRGLGVVRPHGPEHVVLTAEEYDGLPASERDPGRSRLGGNNYCEDCLSRQGRQNKHGPGNLR